MCACVVICCELVPLFNAGRVQCLSLVCWGRPSCHCWVPCPKDEGLPLWLRWWWIYSLALGSPRGPVVHGGVPCEILWIWCKGSWQGWATLFAAYLMLLWRLWTHQRSSACGTWHYVNNVASAQAKIDLRILPHFIYNFHLITANITRTQS